MIVNCTTCKKPFNKDPYRVKKCKLHFCSNSCTRTGNAVACQFCGGLFYTRPKIQARNRGKYCSSICRYKSYSQRFTGENNHNWRGDAVKYNGLHVWVSNNLGKPRLCEQCGTTTAKRFEWANISGEYMRDLKDWKRMCKKCHNDYDGVNAWQQKQIARQIG